MGLTSNKKVDTNTVELEITVGGEEFSVATQTAFEKMSKTITIPGFRKGKAPRKMIEKRYGEGVFIEEAINNVYPAAYQKAVEEANIKPVDTANIEILDANAEGFKFKATVTVKPEVEVSNYKGIEATKEIHTIYAPEVNAEIDKLRKRNSRLVDVDNREAKNEDKAVIDFEGFVDGVAFEGGKGDDYSIVLGSGQFIPGFEEQIIGHKIGEEFDVNVTFPEEYHAEDLKGKEAVFKVTIKSLAIEELPKADDEFAKDISEFDTLKEFKADIKKKMTKAEEDKAELKVEDAIISKVIENMKAEVPEVMFENKIDEMLKDFEYRLNAQGMNLDVYSQYTGTSIEGLRKTFEETATRQVKTRLALEKIVEIEGIKADEKDINEEYERLAKAYNIDAEKVKSFVKKEDLALDIAVGKAIDFLKENAVITEEKIAKKDKE